MEGTTASSTPWLVEIHNRGLNRCKFAIFVIYCCESRRIKVPSHLGRGILVIRVAHQRNRVRPPVKRCFTL